MCTPNDRLCSEAHSSSLRTSEDNASAELTGLSSLLCLLSWQHLKLNKREIINLYRFGNKDAEGRLAFKSWMEGFRNTTGVHAMRSVPEFLKPKASRCSVHGSPWQWEETPKESLTIHKVRSLNHATAHQAAFHQHSIGSPCFVPSSHANHSLAEKGGCVQGFLLEPGPCSIARLTAFARGVFHDPRQKRKTTTLWYGCVGTGGKPVVPGALRRHNTQNPAHGGGRAA